MDEPGTVGADGGECEQFGATEERCHDLAKASGLHAVRNLGLWYFQRFLHL